MNDASLSTTAVAPSGHFEVSPKALIEACGLPEIGPGLADLSVRIDQQLQAPFAVVPGGIVVAPATAADFIASALALREGIELHALGGDAPRLAHRILAHATATTYATTTLAAQSGGAVPIGLIDPSLAGRLPATESDAVAVARALAEVLARRDHLEAGDHDEVVAAARALPFAAPTEVLLTTGGDHRQRVDWSLGRNSYWLSPRPVPWTAQFGSCTASSPSPRAFDAADALRHRLIAAALDDRLTEALEHEADVIRVTIRAALGVADTGVEVVLCPSGTDAELVVLSMTGELGRLLSIVVAPLEIGSGSVPAAGGHHFSTATPLGGATEPGARLDGFDEADIDVRTVDVREDDGRLRDPETVEQEIGTILGASDGPVLLHVVEGSKTGIRLPRQAALESWEAALGDRLIVVVDAAQMRIDQHTVAAHVGAGRLVFVTGSKFFGGPPFSGALLIPPRHAGRAARVDGWQAGLAAYLSRHDVPAGLPGLRAAAAPGPNPGLLVRWAAAIAEMRSFHNASPEIRDEILRALAYGIRSILDEYEAIEIVDSPYTVIPSPDLRGLDELPTIFTFIVRAADGRPLDMAAARRVHRLLAEDVADRLGVEGDERRLAQQRFHLGQPVPVGAGEDPAGALRVAVGAPTLSQIVFDHTRGETWVDRVERELRDVRSAIDKVTLVVGRLDEID